MKVRCIKLIDSSGNRQIRSGWLTLDKVYHVLSVVLDTHGTWSVRVRVDNENDVGLFRMQQFEIVSQKIPPSWIPIWHGSGAFELTTQAWSRPEFWDRFHEHDPETVAAFEVERKRIVSSDP